MDNTSKLAYPNIDYMRNVPGTYDSNKWLQAVKTIYYEENKNQLSRNEALRQATQGWLITEIIDFIHWLRFYEEGSHLKYKFAHNWYGDADVGYLLPIKKDNNPITSNQDINEAKDPESSELSLSEKKKIIERQRNKIIGRLDSAEKLLRSDEGQLFADKEFESLLISLYDLKKKIQMINKKSASDKMYKDMIVRESNILAKKGFIKASGLLYSLAEETNTEEVSPNTMPAPIPASPEPPMVGGGMLGQLPMENKEQALSIGINQFLEKLETGGKTDSNETKDELEVEDKEILVEAQVVDDIKELEPINENITKSVSKPEPEPEAILKSVPEQPIVSKDFDNLLDSAFANLTIQDVILKFEQIAKFYKTREMSRQLALADIMLNRLDLTPFFPGLAEATNKSLEANNYILTRIEDIIAKLHGVLKTKDIDFDRAKPVSPEMENAKQVLQNQDDKDKAKKQLRKDLEDENLKNQLKETPEVDIEEDLEQAVPEVPSTPPAASPVAPPTVPSKVNLPTPPKVV